MPFPVTRIFLEVNFEVYPILRPHPGTLRDNKIKKETTKFFWPQAIRLLPKYRDYAFRCQ